MFMSNILRLCFVFIAVLSFNIVTQASADAAMDCFMCHDRSTYQKRVKHEPAAEGDCLSCHNAHVARFAGLLQEEVKELCFSCHADQADMMNAKNVHIPVRNGECMGCHDPHASNHSGLLKDRLAATCFGCHEELDKPYKNTHAPFAKGQCGSCHQPHQSSLPYLLTKEADSLCLGCHPMGTIRPKHRNFPAELKNCGSCHSPHGSDRPGLVRNALHAPYEEGCQDCHSGKGQPVLIDTCLECHPEVSDEMASSHNHLVRYEQNGCIACHSPHAGDDERLLKGKERHVCGTCHEATFQKYDSKEYKHVMTDACNNCHAPHGSNHPAMFKGPINDICNECHGLHGSFTHPIGEDVFDPRTGQMMTCASCHASKGTDHDYHTRYDRKKALCVQCHAEY